MKYIKILLLCLLVITFTGCSTKKHNYLIEKVDGKEVFTIDGNNKYIESSKETDLVKIDIDGKGMIIAKLYPDIAPITVKNYKKLVSEKFYDNLIFHRVIKDFMIQTGDPLGNGTGGSEEKIKGEFSLNGVENNLEHKRGILSMARAGSTPETEETMNSASSQFFIVHKDSPHLNGNYAAFGEVVDGIKIVDKISIVQTDEYDKPYVDIVIKSIRFVEEVK